MEKHDSCRFDAAITDDRTRALWGKDDSHVEYDPDFLPAIEKAPALKSRRELDRVMQILDDLAVEKLRSMNFEERGAHE
jgi:hypothetical protein